jgi:hypothetical protein
VENAEDLCLLAAAAAADPWSLAVLIPSRRKNFKVAVKTASRLSLLHRDASSVVVSLIRLPLTLSCPGTHTPRPWQRPSLLPQSPS